LLLKGGAISGWKLSAGRRTGIPLARVYSVTALEDQLIAYPIGHLIEGDCECENTQLGWESCRTPRLLLPRRRP
jgi:hypothetical protein